MTRSAEIRAAVADRIEAQGWFNVVRRAHMPSIQMQDIPFAQVFITQETLTPDGDSNVGPPSFIAETVIGISIIRGFDDTGVLDGDIDADCDAIESLLLSDTTLVSFAPDALFESVERITRRRQFPKDGETYFAEMRLEITFLHRVVFDPSVADDYAGATVTVKPLGADADAPYTKFTIDPPAS